MKLIKIKSDIIEERITELTGILTIKISKNDRLYADLSEQEKIPFRIMSAEITALKSYLKGEDLDYQISVSVDYENYCGAEGIKRAKDWIKNVQPIKERLCGKGQNIA
jgi:hypothetical protein